MSVYDSFEGDAIAQTGVMTVPAASESVVGGHCVLMVGYDDSKSAALIRNSWGPDWGQGGYFWMPYSILIGPDTTDFWVVRSVRG